MRTTSVNMIWMVLLSLLSLACHKEKDNSPSEGTVPDPAGQVYHWKKMKDGKVWLKDNLNYAVAGYDSWYYDNDTAYAGEYGRLYTWWASRAACEALGEGWELPSSRDWYDLVKPYGDWETYGEILISQKGFAALIKGGSGGFSAILGGHYLPDPNYGFDGLGEFACYWSGSNGNLEEGNAWYCHFSGSAYGLGGQVEMGNYILFINDIGVGEISGKIAGFSCRCIRD